VGRTKKNTFWVLIKAEGFVEVFMMVEDISSSRPKVLWTRKKSGGLPIIFKAPCVGFWLTNSRH
jgi:hypothetical protein